MRGFSSRFLDHQLENPCNSVTIRASYTPVYSIGVYQPQFILLVYSIVYNSTFQIMSTIATCDNDLSITAVEGETSKGKG